jgi:5-formyltetrahydrofolate cyclo-ligase
MDSTDDTSALSGPALREAKRALRERVLAARDALDAAFRAGASRSIAQRIATLASFRDASCVVLTLAFRSEWDTRALVEDALGRGVAVALPRVNEATRMIELHRVRDVAVETAAGYRGIPEPFASLPRIEPRHVEWILVPGVAFDLHGRRLGYGGGYYDRLLPLLPRAATRIAGAFELQLIDDIPAAPHDLLVDAVATPSRLVLTP